MTDDCNVSDAVQDFVQRLFKARQRRWFSRLQHRVVFADSDKIRVAAVAMAHEGDRMATIEAVEPIMTEIEAPLWDECEATE